MKDNSKIRVVVGMSGGVDSSTAAALLVKQGYDVVGVYMKNWNVESPTLGKRTLPRDSYRDECPWYEDYLDAKRVALKLGIPLHRWDFREEYKKKVFDEFLNEVEKGRTPNPDIYCNNLLKFDDFLKRAIRELQADFVATGHYAKLTKNSKRKNKNLQIPRDKKKDQTYFLYRLSQEQLANVLFPLADYTKERVRELAKELDLPTKYKKDSQGICFIGQVEVRDFLTRWLAPKPGDVRDIEGRAIGKHNGVHLYTIGEKISVDNALVTKFYPEWKHEIPIFYIAEKDVKNNILTVVPGTDNQELYKREAVIESTHWIDPRIMNHESRIKTKNPKHEARSTKWIRQAHHLNKILSPPRRIEGQIQRIHNKNSKPVSNFEIRISDLPLLARIRHGGALIPVQEIKLLNKNRASIFFKESERALTPGQHVVLYTENGVVLGGGVIS